MIGRKENPPVESAQPQRSNKESLPADSRFLIGVHTADSAESRRAACALLIGSERKSNIPDELF